MGRPGNQDLVDFHIGSAVAAARRKGTVLTFSTFITRLRGRNPAVEIHASYVLDRLVRAAKENGVAIEIDRPEEATLPSSLKHY